MTTPALRALNEYRNASDVLDRILDDMQRLMDKLESLGARDNPLGVTSAAAVPDSTAEAVCALQDLTAEMLEAVDAKAAAKRHTKNVIYLVRGKQEGQWEGVLVLRYIKCLSWREVGRELGVPRTTVQRWHDAAVGTIDSLVHLTND